VAIQGSAGAARPSGATRAAAVLAPLTVAALAFAAFAPALSADFVNYDDVDLFVHNPAFRGLGARNLAWMFTTTQMGHYAPLTWLSHAFDFVCSGLDPAAFHRTNLALHALNAALFCIVAGRLLAAARPAEARARPIALHVSAAIAATLFAVHPLRAETVAWITERRGLLDALFLLPALLCYLRACPPGSSRLASRGAYLASIVLLLLSLLSKGIGMTFFGVLLVLDFYPLRRLPANAKAWWTADARRVWIQKLPFLLLGIAFVVVSAWAQASAPDTVKTLEQWGPLARIGQALFGLAFYVRKTLLPVDLAALVELPARFDFGEPRFLWSAVGVALGAAAILLTRKRAPAWTAAASVYVLVLAPVLGGFQSGPQLVADRYSYVACMPWAVLAGAGALVALDRRPALARSALAVAAPALVVVLFALSRLQAATWHDSRTLWSHAIVAGESSSVAHVNLGGLDMEAGDDASAIEHFLAATRVRPDQGLAWFDLGIAYARVGRLEDAERADLEASRTMTPAYKALVNLGNLYMNRMGRLDDAIAAYRAAVADAEASVPGLQSPVPHLVLGVALRRKGLDAEGRAELEIAARHPATRAEALRELGR
jgi:tetratricopeptide (TPR) repeat protein